MQIPNLLSRPSGWSLACCILSLSNSFNGAIADELRVLDAQLIGESSFEVRARIPSGFDHSVLEVWTGNGRWLVQIAGSLDKAQAGTAVFRLPRQVGGSSAMARVRCGQGTSPTAALSDASLFSMTYDAAGDVVPEPVKFDNLDRLMAKRSEWESLSLTQRNTNLQTFALTLPGVSSAGYSSLANTFYIKYTDGDTSLLLDDRARPGTFLLPSSELSRTFMPGVFDNDTPRAVNRQRETRDADSVPEFFPQSQDALCVYSLQPENFPDVTPQVQSWLSRSGYSVTRQVAPTVTEVMGWSGRRFGVVFWQTHAGSLLADDKQHEFMCLVAGERASIAKAQNEYRALRSGPDWELLICGLKDFTDPERKAVRYYALTPKFLQTRLNGMFADHSLFALDACTGAHPDLANIFLGHGAGMHVSWNLPSGTKSAENFQKLFDRLTGANETTPVSTPPERPFRMRETQTWMVERSYDIDTSPPDPDDPNDRGPAFLNWRTSTTKPFYALRPSLYRALTTASESAFPFQKWTLEGDFGDDPGPDKRLVSWGDQILKILSWDEETGIKVQPPNPPYPTGPIEVMIGSHRSNKVPITQWNIPVTYTLTGKGSLQYRIEFTLRLRGDIHLGRAEPSGDLSAHPIVLMQLSDSNGTVTASGQYKPDPDTTIRWGGSKSLSSFYLDNQGATATADFILGSATVNPSGSTATVNLTLMVASLCESFTTTASGTQQSPLGTMLDGFFLPPLTTTINLQTGVLQGQSFTSSVPLSTPNGLSATLVWPSVSPEAPPTAETPR